uniref:Uncharacterized protein n=1 Tax=Oryza nivara TaxID=4536 RepID=A0A0E0GT24_ORYNI
MGGEAGECQTNERGGGHCCSEQGAADKSDGGQGRASVDTSIWVTAVLVGNHEERKERGPIYRLQNPQRAYPT